MLPRNLLQDGDLHISRDPPFDPVVRVEEQSRVQRD